LKIITAIGNEYLNEKLKEIDDYEIIGKDIQYQEGIIDILEIEKNIDILILSNELPEEYSFKELINKIINLKKELEIIVFLKEKNIDIENYLNSKKIYKIYYLTEDGYNLFFNNFNINLNTDISSQISDFKNIILNNENEFKKINFKLLNKNGKVFKNIGNRRVSSLLNNKKNNFKNGIHKIEKNCETIVVTGVCGCGKSITSLILADLIQNKNKKTLLIDFDKLNCTIKQFYNIKKCNFNRQKLNECIVKINNNLDILIDLENFLNTSSLNEESESYMRLNNFEKNNLKDIINNLKKEYEFIIIDTYQDIKNNYIKTILYSGDKIIFLIEPNISEIKKAKNLLEVFINDFNVGIDKIKIVFNKTNNYKIAESILEEIFLDFEIAGEIEYDEIYNLIINKNKIKNYNKNSYEKIYENIIK
jgi:cellulose biosynthesis protein BcsQ